MELEPCELVGGGAKRIGVGLWKHVNRDFLFLIAYLAQGCGCLAPYDLVFVLEGLDNGRHSFSSTRANPAQDMNYPGADIPVSERLDKGRHRWLANAG